MQNILLHYLLTINYLYYCFRLVLIGYYKKYSYFHKMLGIAIGTGSYRIGIELNEI